MLINIFKKLLRRYKQSRKTFIKYKLPAIFCKSGRLSSLYYFLFNTSFDREHQAILFGKSVHIASSNQSKGNYYLLIRNTHRLEKGLLMQPKRDVFAKDYIKETVDNFIRVWSYNEMDTNPQMRWFYDVLKEYFRTASKDNYIKIQYERFLKKIHVSAQQTEHSCKRSIPYIRSELDRSSICFDEYYKLAKQRRSVRFFLSKAVDRTLIDKAILAASQSPSACNRQPFTFYIFDDPELVKEVVNYPMGTKGYSHTIPVFIVIVGNLDAYFDERDRHLIYIDASLASMSFMLALETMGISSCPINWPDIEDRERKMEKFLKLATYQRPLMCIGLGYPDPEALVAYSEKRPIDQLRIYNN